MTADCISCVWVHLVFSFFALRGPSPLIHDLFFSCKRTCGCCCCLSDRELRAEGGGPRTISVLVLLSNLAPPLAPPPGPAPMRASGLHRIWTFTLCLVPLVLINTCFELLVNKTEHRYECVIKRWEDGSSGLLVVCVCVIKRTLALCERCKRETSTANQQRPPCHGACSPTGGASAHAPHCGGDVWMFHFHRNEMNP